MAMLTKLIEATGHQLTLNVEALPGRRLGLPDTPLGRRLRRHRRTVTDLAERRGLRNVRVFGSVARGEDREGSDIDLLVDVNEGVGLVAIAGLARELTDLLGVPVDVVPADSLKRSLRAEALAEAVPL
jgi:predicted nucleotidyltransferase